MADRPEAPAPAPEPPARPAVSLRRLEASLTAPLRPADGEFRRLEAKLQGVLMECVATLSGPTQWNEADAEQLRVAMAWLGTLPDRRRERLHG